VEGIRLIAERCLIVQKGSGCLIIRVASFTDLTCMDNSQSTLRYPSPSLTTPLISDDGHLVHAHKQSWTQTQNSQPTSLSFPVRDTRITIAESIFWIDSVLDRVTFSTYSHDYP
jgi:hypothetical protein